MQLSSKFNQQFVNKERKVTRLGTVLLHAVAGFTSGWQLYLVPDCGFHDLLYLVFTASGGILRKQWNDLLSGCVESHERHLSFAQRRLSAFTAFHCFIFGLILPYSFNADLLWQLWLTCTGRLVK